MGISGLEVFDMRICGWFLWRRTDEMYGLLSRESFEVSMRAHFSIFLSMLYADRLILENED